MDKNEFNFYCFLLIAVFYSAIGYTVINFK